MLDIEFQYYLDHQDELVDKYFGKYLVIKGLSVIGVHDTEIMAYENAIKNHPAGTFMVQHCTPGIEAYTQTYYSRVVF